MGNSFAYLALLAWPIIALFFYRHLEPLTATFWTIVGGYLLLPVKVAIDFPLIPPMDKESISALAAMAGMLLVARRKVPLMPGKGIERWLFMVIMITPLITVFNNPEPIYRADGYLPGLTLHDAFSAIVNQYLALVPFLLGLFLVRGSDDLLKLLKLLVVAGLCYTLPILFEIRLSPQLHTWIYGFFPHSFGQQFRFGGFRAVVFLGHGLLVATFIAVVLGAAALLWKQRIATFGLPPGMVVLYLLLVLLLSKTVGAFVLGVMLFLMIVFASVRLTTLLARLLIAVVVLYPLLSIMDLFPHQALLDWAAVFDVQRAQSLGFRFMNELSLLAHAQEKFIFGWGGWGRNLLTGSVVDGYWIQVLGQYGLVGFVALFALAFAAVFRGVKIIRYLPQQSEQQIVAGYVLMMAVVMVDQVPNHSMANLYWLLIGGLSGAAHGIFKQIRQQKKVSQNAVAGDAVQVSSLGGTTAKGAQ